MKYLERSYKAIINRPLKSLLIMTMIFLIANITVGASLIENATSKLELSFKEEIGALATINSNIDYYRNKKIPMEPNGINIVYNEFVTILDEIRQIEHVSNVDYRTTSEFGFNSKSIYTRYDCVADDICHDVTMSGVASIQFNELVSGVVELTEGRSFDELSISEGLPVALISDTDEIFDENWDRIEVGDTILFEYFHYEFDNQSGSVTQHIFERFEEEVLVIGKFKENPSTNTLGINKEQLDFSKHIFLPGKFLHDKRLEVESYYQNNTDSNIEDMGGITRLNNVRILISNPDFVDDVETEMDTILNSSKTHIGEYEILTSIEEYEKIMGPISSIRSIGNIVKYSSLLVAMVLTSIIVLFIMKERKREIGVYMALGETKIKIWLQLLIELLIISLVAIGLAVMSSQSIAQSISNNLINNIASNDIKTILIEDVSKQTLEERFEVKIDFIDTSTTISLILLVVVVSASFPIYFTLQMNPKRVLIN